MAKECSNSSCTKESCEGCPSKEGGGIQKEMLNIYSEIRHVIGIVSGKGGVGKSFATASLANQLAKRGFRVGIMDADITGPSIPKMYGLKGPCMIENEDNVLPLITDNGIKVMSVNLLLPNEEDPVVWRGPVLANMMNVPILGIIENYSYLECPDCGKKISVFGESHIDEIGASLGIDVVGKVPISPMFAEAADAGKFADVDNTFIAAAVEKMPR